MRNWINIILEHSETVAEDLDIDKIEDNKIVLDDPCGDEVEALRKDSPEEKKKVVKRLERDIHKD